MPKTKITKAVNNDGILAIDKVFNECLENWKEVRLEKLVYIERGITFPASAKNDMTTEGLIGCARTANIQKDFIWDDMIYVDQKYMKSNTNKLVRANDILMSTANSHHLVGKCVFMDELVDEICFGGFLVSIRPKKHLNAKFLYYLFQKMFYFGEMRSIASITTNIANINGKRLGNIQFLLPPLPEQQRIVNRIESLFEKIDKAESLINEAREGFERRKEAILAAAFRGELTEKWREEHENLTDTIKLEQRYHNNKFIVKSKYQEDLFEEPFEIPKCWKWVKLSEVGKLERGKSKHRPRNDKKLFGGVYPFIQTGDVARASQYILEHHQTLSEFGINQSKLFPDGTVCITIAANIGDAAILSYECAFPDSVVGFTPNSLVQSKYVYYYLTIMKSILEKFAPATAQKNINLAILNEVKIPLLSINEQKFLIDNIEKIFEEENRVFELSDLNQDISSLKKAILAKAFRGELGTNNAEDSQIDIR